MIKSSCVALALFGALSFNQATAAVITFDGLAGSNIPGATFRSPGEYTQFSAGSSMARVSVGGLDFSSNGHFTFIGPAFGGGDDQSLAWNGTDFIAGGPELVISQTGGGGFTLNSLDLATTSDNMFGQNIITVVGTFMGGGSISVDLLPRAGFNSSLQVGNDFVPFTLTGFNNLSSVSLAASTLSYALDNLNISPGPNVVPEPGTIAIIMAGLLPLGFMIRRRNRSL